MQAMRDPMLHVIERGGGALTDADRVIAMTTTACEPSDESGFEKKTLAVDDRVIVAFAQAINKTCDFPPRLRCKRGAAPAPQCNWNDLVYRRVETNEWCKGFLDHPTKMRAHLPAARFGNRRYVVDYVAERGCLDEQDVRHASARHTYIRSAASACERRNRDIRPRIGPPPAGLSDQGRRFSRNIEAGSGYFNVSGSIQAHYVDRACVFGRTGIVGSYRHSTHLCRPVPVAKRDVIGAGCRKLIVPNEPRGTQSAGTIWNRHIMAMRERDLPSGRARPWSFEGYHVRVVAVRPPPDFEAQITK